MKTIAEKSRRRAAFTIIELLTIMSIIILLIGLLVPALNMVKNVARKVVQRNQFHAITVALETFNTEWEEYPDSAGGGAAELCTAMVGEDLLGYDPLGVYAGGGDLSNRRHYLKLDSANAFTVDNLFNNGDLRHVLCDMYTNIEYQGKFIGMPVLYYKANTSKTGHSADSATAGNSIYDYRDNQDMVSIPIPWETGGAVHPMSTTAQIFYDRTRNNKIQIDELPEGRPYRAESYILLSAGRDGVYGTQDDIYNF
ncbi:MAG: hypothetical protein ACYTBJ_14245 [Planctomycetota bacterium]